jgi:hypothetical protein
VDGSFPASSTGPPAGAYNNFEGAKALNGPKCRTNYVVMLEIVREQFAMTFDGKCIMASQKRKHQQTAALLRHPQELHNKTTDVREQRGLDKITVKVTKNRLLGNKSESKP